MTLVSNQATAEAVLGHYFGYQAFRPGQDQIVSAVLNGRDTLAILPTGGGKSVCFQVPGLIMGGTTIVISPLISLMQDQVQRLVSLGIKATFINSSLSDRELRERIRLMRQGYWQFIYLAPERLQSPHIASIWPALDCKLVVIDEAHCISEWGHDFRPAYLEIEGLIKLFKRRPVIMALTATATAKTQQDIIHSLGLENHFHFFHTFRRPNLQLKIVPCQFWLQKELMLIRILISHRGQSGIIYVATRIAAEELANWLNCFHIFHKEVLAYHGGLEHVQRQVIQQAFIQNQNPVIVATNAFGMGIDKPDIRFVVHYHLPGTLENYVQEIGRAGRDGLASDCYLLSLKEDRALVGELTAASSKTSVDYQNHIRRKWRAMQEFVDQPTCRVVQVLAYFGEPSQPCGQCDVCQPIFRYSSIEEQRLFSLLIKTRTEIAAQCHRPQAFVTPVSILKWLALLQPKTPVECLVIPGVGAGWLQRWWPVFSPIMAPADNSTTGQPHLGGLELQPVEIGPAWPRPGDNCSQPHTLVQPR